jgi:hypothetical protein
VAEHLGAEAHYLPAEQAPLLCEPPDLAPDVVDRGLIGRHDLQVHLKIRPGGGEQQHDRQPVAALAHQGVAPPIRSARRAAAATRPGIVD